MDGAAQKPWSENHKNWNTQCSRMPHLNKTGCQMLASVSGDLIWESWRTKWLFPSFFGFVLLITISPLFLTRLSIYLSMVLRPFVGPWQIFQFHNIIHSRWDSLDGGSARRKAATYTQNNTNTINAHRHPCPEWDSNSQSQRSSERTHFMPQTARPPWSPYSHLTVLEICVSVTRQRCHILGLQAGASNSSMEVARYTHLAFCLILTDMGPTRILRRGRG
jgi:hypothetical protein